MDYKSRYLKYKRKYLEIKRNTQLWVHIFNHTSQSQFPPLPPTPDPFILNSLCGICHNKLGEGDIDDITVNAYIQFKCKHKFHYGCCSKWCFQKLSTVQICSCPICRSRSHNYDIDITLFIW